MGRRHSRTPPRRGPDWRWLHVGETAIFFLVPALFLQFYCGNWPNRFSTPINVLVRSLLVTLGGIAIYCLYYKYAHFVLGTQKGFSHPQQFPMIPMIWLINIWLINWWFMDGWPGWRREFKTAEDFAAEERHLAANAAWNPCHAARRDHRPRRGRDRLLRHRGPAASGERNFHSGSIGGTIWTDANS